MTENKKTIEQLKKELREAEEDLERAELERKIRETRMKAAEARGFGGHGFLFGKSGGTPGFGIGKIGDDPFADKFGDDPFADKFGDDPFADKVCDALFKRMEIENARRDLERARAEAKLIGCMPSLEACLLSAALIR